MSDLAIINKQLLLMILLLGGWFAMGCDSRVEQTGAGGGPPEGSELAAGTRWHDPLAGLDMVWVPSGSFVMGAGADEIGRQANDMDEDPAHLVTISRGFWFGRCEVTQDQWEAVMGTPSQSLFSGGDRPVENVSWNDIQLFLDRLNQRAGSECYRLPTEAEWEYACRAGSGELYSFGRSIENLGQYAWFAENSGDLVKPAGRTHPVGRLKPNHWGLYDMHGNVWEYCSDFYSADFYHVSPEVDPRGPSTGWRRVKRGGSWFYRWYRCRSADRARGEPSLGTSSVGFRLARDAG